EFGCGITADRQCAVQPADGRNHDDVSRMLLPHGGQHSLGHRDLTKEVGFKLQPDFFQRYIFGEASHGKACIVNQHVDAAILADNFVGKAANGAELSDIETSHVKLIGKCGKSRVLHQPSAPSDDTHGSHHHEYALINLNSSENY